MDCIEFLEDWERVLSGFVKIHQREFSVYKLKKVDITQEGALGTGLPMIVKLQVCGFTDVPAYLLNISKEYGLKQVQRSVH